MLAHIVPTSARRLPRAVPVAKRFYAEEAFHKKERAHEDQFARQLEKAQLEKMKAEINRKKAELAELEKQHAQVEEQVKTGGKA